MASLGPVMSVDSGAHMPCSGAIGADMLAGEPSDVALRYYGQKRRQILRGLIPTRPEVDFTLTNRQLTLHENSRKGAVERSGVPVHVAPLVKHVCGRTPRGRMP